MSWNALWPILFSVIGLAAVWRIYLIIRSYAADEVTVAEISDQIYLGAVTFMRREHKILGIVSGVLVLVLWALLGFPTAIAFIFGALTAGVVGHVGIHAAKQTNARAATGAHEQGSRRTLSVTFWGASLFGLVVASLGLLGLGTLYLCFGGNPQTANSIYGFGMGASIVALFTQISGGIFTSSGEARAHSLARSTTGSIEKSPHNPSAIATCVEENFSGVAGTGSCLFDSYCCAIIASIAVATTIDLVDPSVARSTLMLLPLGLASVGLLCSIGGILLARVCSTRARVLRLRVGFLGATGLFILASFLLVWTCEIALEMWCAIAIGAIGGLVIRLINEYYAGNDPAQEIIKPVDTGQASVVIECIARGMGSVAIPMLLICIVVAVSAQLVGFYGICIAAVGMLATVGITLGIDSCDSMANATRGISEMSVIDGETRKIAPTQGNPMGPIGKGTAIGASALAALAIIAAFIQTLIANDPDFSLELTSPENLIGLFLGGALPFIITGLTLTAVGDVARSVVNGTHRRVAEATSSLKSAGELDAAQHIEIASAATHGKALLPGLVALTIPWIVGFGIGPHALGGFLTGALLTSVLLALMLTNTGWAWRDTEKRMGMSDFEGQGDDAQASNMVSNTGSGPLKDTAGPAMCVLINVMAIISLVIAPLL